MGKTRDLLKRIRDIKGTFHAKMGSIKDRNGMDLTVEEDIKKRSREYTEKNYTKKLLMTQITTMCGHSSRARHHGVLGCIAMNKASGSDGITAELFQILKDNSALNMPANLENSAVATGLEKVSFHSNPKERQYQRMFKLPHNCTHFTC